MADCGICALVLLPSPTLSSCWLILLGSLGVGCWWPMLRSESPSFCVCHLPSSSWELGGGVCKYELEAGRLFSQCERSLLPKNSGHLLPSVSIRPMYLTHSTSRISWNLFLLHHSQHPGPGPRHLSPGLRELPSASLLPSSLPQSAFCQGEVGPFLICFEGGHNTLVAKWTNECI